MITTNEKFTFDFLDSSRISTVQRCEARFLFKCLMGLAQPDESKLALDYGTVMHKVLPKMYNGGTDEAFAEFDRLWKRFPYGESDTKRNTSRARAQMLNFILSHNKNDCPYEIMHYEFAAPADLISENEVPFLIDIGIDVPYCGRLDAVIRWKTTGELWTYDFKTSSELSPRYFDGFWLCPQAVGYTLAARQITAEKINGMVYEGMRISASNVENQLGFTFVTENNLITFIEEANMTCKQIQHANETGCWRQNHALCSTYSSFGHPSRQCEYKMICDLGKDWFTGTKFFAKNEPFNPLKVDVLDE